MGVTKPSRPKAASLASRHGRNRSPSVGDLDVFCGFHPSERGDLFFDALPIRRSAAVILAEKNRRAPAGFSPGDAALQQAGKTEKLAGVCTKRTHAPGSIVSVTQPCLYRRFLTVSSTPRWRGRPLRTRAVAAVDRPVPSRHRLRGQGTRTAGPHRAPHEVRAAGEPGNSLMAVTQRRLAPQIASPVPLRAANRSRGRRSLPGTGRAVNSGMIHRPARRDSHHAELRGRGSSGSPPRSRTMAGYCLGKSPHHHCAQPAALWLPRHGLPTFPAIRPIPILKTRKRTHRILA